MGKDGQIVWYQDEEIAIIFNKIPNLGVRYATPWMTKEETKEINQKPFICEEELKVELKDNDILPRA